MILKLQKGKSTIGYHSSELANQILGFYFLNYFLSQFGFVNDSKATRQGFHYPHFV